MADLAEIKPQVVECPRCGSTHYNIENDGFGNLFVNCDNCDRTFGTVIETGDINANTSAG